jgi:drug/metabolite transporter (DMT)-like permease
MERGHVDSVTAAAFVGAAVIGGANFVAVKETVDELDPLYGAMLRFGFACLVFLAVLAATRTRLPHGRALVGAALYGALGFGIAYACMYVALLELSVGVVAILLGATPVFTLVLAALQRMETLTVRGLVGGGLAVAGITILSARSLAADVPIGYLVAAFVAPVAVAQATIVAKRFPRMDPVATNGVGMAVGAALLGTVSLIAGEAWTVPQAAVTWAATAWLVLAGSVGMFWLFLLVVQRWTASASAYITPLMPVVAVALAAVLTGESIGVEEIAGGVLVIAGAYVGTLRAPVGVLEADDFSAPPTSSSAASRTG